MQPDPTPVSPASGTTADDVYLGPARALVDAWNDPVKEYTDRVKAELATERDFRAAVDEARRGLQQQLDQANAELTEYRKDLGEICYHYDRPCGCPNAPDPGQAYMVMREARDEARAALAAAEAARDEATTALAANTGDSGEWQYGVRWPAEEFDEQPEEIDGWYETADEALSWIEDRQVGLLIRRRVGPVEPVTEDQP